MTGKPSLKIPIELDGSSAIASLKTLHDQGTKTTGELAEGMDKASDATKGATTSHESLTAAMLNVNVAQKAMAVGTEILTELSAAAVASSQKLKEMAEQFINLRDRAKELAGVLGKPATSAFTQEQLQFASQVGSKPEDAVTFRTGFQGEANQYQGRFEPGEYEKFEVEAARYANQMKLPPDIASKIAGVAIRTGPMKGQTSESALNVLGQSFKALQGGSGDNPILAGQLQQAGGLVGPDNAFRTMQEASVGIRMQAEFNQSEAYSRNMEMRQSQVELTTDDKKEEKAKELGIDIGTPLLDAVKIISEKQKNSGKALDAFLADYFTSVRARLGWANAVKSYRAGVTEAGFKDAATVKPGDVERETAAAFADPEQGLMLDQKRAETEARKGELSQDTVRIQPLLEEAKKQMAQAELNPRYGAMIGLGNLGGYLVKGPMGQGYQGFEQAEMGLAMRNATARARQAGIDTGDAPSVTFGSQANVTHYLSELIKLTKEANDKRAALAPPARTLSAPPAPTPGRPPGA